MDSIYYLLQYLNNWDSYGPKIETAPLPESRRDKYNDIMAKYRSHEIGGRDVTCELTGWLANFDNESRHDFIDWVALNSANPISFIEDHQIKNQIILNSDEMSVLKKCIKAAVGLEPLKEIMHDDACKLYDRINK